MKALKKEHLARLKPLEAKLQAAVARGNASAARAAMEGIQELLLGPYGHHSRLLECRLWYFESLLDANDVMFAESGFEGIRSRAGKTTWLYTEATFLLAVCFLRQKRAKEAKPLFRWVLEDLKKETVTPCRLEMQKRVIQRIEEESILSQLIGLEDGPMKADKIQQEAIEVIKRNDSETEIFERLARSLPYGTSQLLQDVRNDALLQIPLSDQKLLPAPGQVAQPAFLGRRVYESLHRVGWNTLCDVESPFYKLWSQKPPEIYTGAYFAGAMMQAFQNWRIGVPALAVGTLAIVMKYGAQEYCRVAKPASIMELRRKRK